MSRLRWMMPALLMGAILAGFANVATAADTPARPSRADDPDVQYRAMMNNLANNRPQAIWTQLPKSYQNDVQELVREFAGKMDAELWDTSFGVAQKFAKVLKTKRELILNHPLAGAVLAKSPLPPEAIHKNWDTGADLLGTLVNSDLSNIDTLKKADINGFLSTTGTKLMTQAAELNKAVAGEQGNQGFVNVENFKVSVVSRDGDSAVMRIEQQGEEPTEKEVVRIEGKWLLKDMADGWKEGVAQARENIAALSPEVLAQQKAQFLPVLKTLDGGLDKLLAANDAESFNNALIGLIGPLMPIIHGMGQ